MRVGDVRAIEGLTVVHDPILPGGELPPNRAHTNVVGNKKAGHPKARVLLQEISTIVPDGELGAP